MQGIWEDFFRFFNESVFEKFRMLKMLPLYRKKFYFSVELQIEDKVILETFFRWVRTSANFEEVPWLSFEPEVSKLPSARNNSVSSTFLTAESFSVCLNEPNELSVYHFIFSASLRLLDIIQFVYILTSSFFSLEIF